MSPDGTNRRALLLLVPVGLAACGFAPAYGPGGPGTRLEGRVAVEAPDTPEGYRLRARMEERLGRAAAAPDATLRVELATERSPALTEEDGSTLRSHLRGRAAWRLARTSGAALAQGEESAFVAASEGDLAAGGAAATDARDRLMRLLADRILDRLLLLPPEALP